MPCWAVVLFIHLFVFKLTINIALLNQLRFKGSHLLFI